MLVKDKLMHPKVRHPREFMNEAKGINHKVAKGVASVLGSMPFFYFCVILDIAELPSVISSNSVELWVTYIAQTVVQLLALPILQVYQNLIQEQNDAKAEADHQTLTYIAQLQDEQYEILKLLKDKK